MLVRAAAIFTLSKPDIFLSLIISNTVFTSLGVPKCAKLALAPNSPIYTTGVFGECCERNASIAARFAAGHPTKRTR